MELIIKFLCVFRQCAEASRPTRPDGPSSKIGRGKKNLRKKSKDSLPLRFRSERCFLPSERCFLRSERIFLPLRSFLSLISARHFVGRVDTLPFQSHAL